MTHKLILPCLAFWSAVSSATTVSLHQDQIPAEVVTSIQSELKRSNARVYYDLADRVLQIWAPLDLRLPSTSKIQRGRVLRDLVNVLRGERRAGAPWSLLLKNPAVTITDVDGHAIAWEDLSFPVHHARLAGDADAAVAGFFAHLPAAHVRTDSGSTVGLRGTLRIDLGALDPTTRREVRRRFEEIFGGGRDHRAHRYDVDQAAIEFIPDDGPARPTDVPDPGPARPTLRHALRITSGPGWTLDQCVVKNVVDFEIWLSRNFKPDHDVVLDLDDAAIAAGHRADFRRMFQEYLDLGFLPKGYQLPPNRVRVSPTGADFAPSQVCQGRLRTP